MFEKTYKIAKKYCDNVFSGLHATIDFFWYNDRKVLEYFRMLGIKTLDNELLGVYRKGCTIFPTNIGQRK